MKSAHAARLASVIALLAVAGCGTARMDGDDGTDGAAGSDAEAAGGPDVPQVPEAPDGARLDPQNCLTAGPGDGGLLLVVKALTPQSGSFEIQFAVTPRSSGVGTGFGFSAGEPSGVGDLATVVRFRDDGVVDVLDGDCGTSCSPGPYRAAALLRYAAGETYRVRQLVDLTRKRYSVYVASANGTELLLASDHAFRPAFQSIGALDHWSVTSSAGESTVCASEPQPIAPAPDAAADAGPAQVDAGPGAADAAARCGDGACELGESCGSCAVDCGQCPAGRVVAFPGCEGAGCDALGGRGGTVYKVTNTDDSGAGSLRACVEATGRRTCVFEVGGRIDTRSQLEVKNPYLTIAGQTAPGGGLEVVGVVNAQGIAPGYVFVVRTSHVVVRYVRFFNDAHPACEAGSQGCGVVSLLPASQDVVLDHVTTAFTQDQNLTVYAAAPPGPKNLTVSWSLNAYPLADHPTGSNISGGTPEASASLTDIDFHHNYYADVSHRIFGGGAKRVRWTHNVILNYQNYASRTGMGVVDDFVGNIYRCGNQTLCTRWPLTLGEWEKDWPAGTPSIFFSNNVWKEKTGALKVAGDLSDADQWARMVYMVANSSVEADSSVPAPVAYRRASPNPAPASGTPIADGPLGPYSGYRVAADGANLEAAMFDLTPAGDAARRTPFGPVGASRKVDCTGRLVNNLDGLLQRAITEYVGGGDPTYAPSGGCPRPTTQTSICWAPNQCGVPVLDRGVPCGDLDDDGMSDSWESAVLAGKSDLDPSGLDFGDGYTNLEHYLNGTNPLP